jgi:Ca2+-binding EF-hand superfamily protein
MKTSLKNPYASGPVLVFLAAGLTACGADQSGPVDQSSARLGVDGGETVEEESAEGPRDGHRRHRGAGRGFAHMIERFDTNGDGVLQLSELPPGLQKHLGDADTNKDGLLTREELEAHMKMRGKQRFAEKDTNGDGALTEDEVGRHWKFISVADADGDGAVTLAELEAAHESGKLRWGKHGRRHGFGHKGGKGAEMLIERFDANGDGLLQLSELPEHKREWLTGADADGDGAISKEELEAYFEDFKGRKGKGPRGHGTR